MKKGDYQYGLFPLRIFLFPGEQTTLHIFEPRYLQLVTWSYFGTLCPKELKKLKRKNKEKKIFLTISFCLHKNRCLVTRKPFIYQKIMTKGMFKSKNLATNEPV
jgi:hypothetical protein